MGLENHVDGILREAKLAGSYFWSNGLNTSEKDAKKIMKILDGTGEFGPTRYNKQIGKIEFGVVEQFYVGDRLAYDSYFKDFKNWLVDAEGERMEGQMSEKSEVFSDAGFYFGRMLSGSKSGYNKTFPDHKVVFNSRVYDLKTYEREKDGAIKDWFAGQPIEIWYGDLDLTIDNEKLKEIANKIGTFVITTEHGSYITTIEKEK